MACICLGIQLYIYGFNAPEIVIPIINTIFRMLKKMNDKLSNRYFLFSEIEYIILYYHNSLLIRQSKSIPKVFFYKLFK